MVRMNLNWKRGCLPDSRVERMPARQGTAIKKSRQWDRETDPARSVSRFQFVALVAILLVSFSLIAQNIPGSILSTGEMRTWLTYLSSDDLEGRGTFSEGLGLAASYIADQLKDGGVTAGADHGSYFQRVTVMGIRNSDRSTLTVETKGQTRTFRNGEGVTFQKFVGGPRTFTVDQVDFLGYNPDSAKASDYKDKVVVWLESPDPTTLLAAEEGGIAAVLTPGFSAAGSANGDNGALNPDFVTSQRLDLPHMPSITLGTEVLDFLFSASDTKYDEIRSRSDRRESLKTFSLKGVRLTIKIDPNYRVVSTQFTRNVVGIVEGSDPQLKSTYVAFGAHYDHLGYIPGPLYGGTSDRIYNGADDDGSGTTTLIGLARAFAKGPKPKRSLVFVWHAGEELGLFGSRYFADNPPDAIGNISNVVTQLNIDMIGRNRDNKPSEAGTIYAVGADRISTELHNTLVESNASLPRPLSINFEMNDPSDSERIYYRSDHFSYASKGIPIIFFFSGLHPDYHQVTDTVDKIDFDKMARVGQLVYEIGRRVGNMERAPVRDFKGPRAGRGFSGKLSTN
jgi:Zn-dependent M28 family amino/carboxypeptidase